MEQSCKTCIWLEVPRNKRGTRLVRKGAAYPCRVPIKTEYLPDCMTLSASYVPIERTPRVRMEGDMGADCPKYLHHDWLVARVAAEMVELEK